jgi:hypothetical protein
MYSRTLILTMAVFLSCITTVWAQTPTPTAVVSNIAVSAYAQSRGEDLSGTPCTTRGGTGCGGCYPMPIPSSDPIEGALAVLNLFNPEWQALGPMISGGDPSLPPASLPVRIEATAALSKSPGDDFPDSHITSDYNIEMIPDDNGRLASGDTDKRLEFEWEGDKFPLYMWAGEGDRLIAEGRWIFDCGHADPGPQGKCSNDGAVCNVDGDCPSGGTCTNPAPTFNYQAELHPPHAVAVLRSKSKGKTPATRADVYISADAGGASDRCTVTHLAAATDVLLNKGCLLNHCSVTTSRSCIVDKDCAHGETCLRFDPNNRIADINASDFEFDMPLPAKPATATAVKIKTTKMKVPKGSVMPKPVFDTTHITDPTPSIHVTVPMTVPIKGKLPNIFAQSILATWKGDKSKLKHVQVKFTGVTVNNPVKDSTPPVPHVCSDPTTGPTTTACEVDSDCNAGTCAATDKACHSNKDCKPTDFCTGASLCIGGVTPGWRVWGEVNGDWVELAGFSQVGTQPPFQSPPYTRPSTPLVLKQKAKFNEYVPADGTIHIKVSGRSFNCLNSVFGHNLKDLLGFYGVTAGADCLLNGGSHDPGTVDITLTGPDFGGSGTFSVPSSGADAGTCSATTNRLCVGDADCPGGESCNVTGDAYTLAYTVKVFP